jgi:hypothetical protein
MKSYTPNSRVAHDMLTAMTRDEAGQRRFAAPQNETSGLPSRNAMLAPVASPPVLELDPSEHRSRP